MAACGWLVGALAVPAFGGAAWAAPLPTSDRMAAAVPPASESYSLLSSNGVLTGFGAAVSGTTPAPSSPVVGVAPTPDGHGAWVAEADGAVVALGDAVSHGSMAGTGLTRPVVGIAADDATGGYWLVASDGGVFSFDAPFLGSTGSIHLNRPIVGISGTPDGLGYRLVASDGGIFTFGDAAFRGSTGAIHLNRPIVGMSTTSDGTGYWLVASDGGIFTFGDAAFYGSGAGTGQTVVGMTVGDGGYRNPLRDITGLRSERIDQGVDYGGSGPVYALGDGVVTNTVNSGWPGGAFISYRLLDGPARGHYVYVAENVVPSVTVGQVVNSSTVLGTLVNAYPDMETGWANPPGLGDAAAGAAGQWTTQAESSSLPTAYGLNFSQLMTGLGAPPGVSRGAPVGALPAGWPTW